MEEVVRNNAVTAPVRRRWFRLSLTRAGFIQVGLSISSADTKGGRDALQEGGARLVVCGLALLLFVGAPSKGDEPQATVLEAVRTILEQRPAEARRLFQTYDFDSVGHSPYLGGDKVDAALRGRRVGPYTLYARPKGAAGPAQWKIIIKTEIQYRDSRGQPVDISQAKSVAENFQGVTVVELEAPDPRLFGRWRTERIEDPWKAFYRSVEWQFGEDLTFTARYFTLEGEKATEGHFEISRGRLFYGSRARNTWGIVDLVIESADRLRVSQPGPDGTSSVWVFRRVR